MRTQLIELFTWLFTRDNTIIDDVISKFDDYNQDSFTRPPEDIPKFVDTLLGDDTCELVKAVQHTEEHESNCIKIPVDSIEFWFKFKDVKLKRRKIFRLGDYYLRVINTGFDKWVFKFYTKQQGVLDGKLVEDFVYAQHPHISHGNACFAGMETAITASVTNYNFTGFIWHIRRFLTSWNYRSPHHQPEDFEKIGRLPLFNEHMLKEAFIKSDSMYPIEQNIWSLTNKYDDVVGYNIKLTSARKREYESEPLSRTIRHIECGSKYYNENIETLHFKGVKHIGVYNLALWLQTKVTDCPSLNEAFMLVLHYVRKLYITCYAECSDVTGEWHQDYDYFDRDISNAISTNQYFYVNQPEIEHRYHDRGTKLFDLCLQGDNESYYEEFKEAINALRVLQNRFINWKDTLQSQSVNYGVMLKNVYNNVSNLINTDTLLWDNAESFIKYVDNLEVATTKREDISTLMENANRDFYVQLDIIEEIHKQVKIEYYEKELRRLKQNEKSTVQIENLNL